MNEQPPQSKSRNASTPDPNPGGTDIPIPCVIHVSVHGSIRWVNQSLLDELNLPPGALKEKQIENTQAILPGHYLKTVLDILKQVSEAPSESGMHWAETDQDSKMLVRWIRSGDDIEIHFFPQTGLIHRHRILERYVPPEILRMSESRLDELRLPERRILTVSFTDLRGFTALSETLEPEESRNLLNTYLSCIMERVWNHQGWVDKLIGDEVMALYGAKAFTRIHAFNAVRSACSQIKEMERIQETHKNAGKPMLPCGIGIHSGNMLIGNIGSDSYQEFTVIGSVVNLTSRIANVAGPGQILLTEETLDAFLDGIPTEWECREIRKRGHQDHGLEEKRRQFIDELLPLSPDQDGKTIAVGPNVITEQERAIYHFTYRCRVVVKGIIRPVPLIEAKQIQADTLDDIAQDHNAEETPEQPQQEKLLGKYQLIHRIGDLEQGKIWKARDNYGNFAAVKTFEIPQERNDTFDTNLAEWISHLTQLRHNNFARIFEAGQSDGILFLASDFIEGQSAANDIFDFKTRKETFRALPTRFPITSHPLQQESPKTRSSFPNLSKIQEKRSKAARNYYIEQLIKISTGIDLAYSQGFLRPLLQWDDIIVDETRGWVLSSFRWIPESLAKVELAKIISERHNNLDTIKGICLFNPPEVAKNSEPVQAHSHIYSLGILLRWAIKISENSEQNSDPEFITPGIAKLKHPKSSERETQKASLFQETLRDKDLEAITQKACATDPEQRYHTLETFISDLRNLLENKEVLARKSTWAYRLERSYSRNKGKTHTAIGTLALITLLSLLALDAKNQFNSSWDTVFDYQGPAGFESIPIWNEIFDTNLNEFHKNTLRPSESISTKDADLKYFRLKATVSFDRPVGFLDIKLKSSEQRRSDQEPTMVVRISANEERNHTFYAAAPDFPVLSHRSDIPTVSLTSGTPIEVFIEHSPSKTIIQIADHLKEFESFSWIPFGYNHLEFSSKSSTNIKIQNLHLSEYRSPTYSNPVQNIDLFSSETNKDRLIDNYLEIIENPSNKKWHQAAFKRAQYLHLKYNTDHRKRLISAARISEHAPNLLKLFENLERETQAWHAWIAGDYRNALSKLQDIYQANPQSKIAQVLASKMPRTASRAEGQRLIYWLGQTREIEEINIDEGIGAVSLEPLAGLELQKLKIRNSGIYDLSPLENMPIWELDLSGNQIEDLSPLKTMPLTVLNLAGNQIRSLEFFNTREKLFLSELNLSANPLTDLEPLQKHRIQSLKISQTHTENTSPLEHITDLEKLDLSATPIEAIDWTRPLLKLRELDLSRTRIHAADFLTQTPHLERLSLAHTAASVLPETPLTNLRELDLSFSQFEDLDSVPIDSIGALKTIGVTLRNFDQALGKEALQWEFIANWVTGEIREKALRKLSIAGNPAWTAQVSSIQSVQNLNHEPVALGVKLKFADALLLANHFDRVIFNIDSDARLNQAQEIARSQDSDIWVRVSGSKAYRSLNAAMLASALNAQGQHDIERILWTLDANGSLSYEPDSVALPLLDESEESTPEPTISAQITQ